jgi:low affinity Fe/Cu permease
VICMSKKLGESIANFANWVNEHVVGNPWTFVVCIVLVFCCDLMIPVQGYDKWNLSTGLFFNTQSSNMELITGVGAVVGVYGVRKANKKHSADLKELHGKVDQLVDAAKQDQDAG